MGRAPLGTWQLSQGKPRKELMVVVTPRTKRLLPVQRVVAILTMKLEGKKEAPSMWAA